MITINKHCASGLPRVHAYSYATPPHPSPRGRPISHLKLVETKNRNARSGGREKFLSVHVLPEGGRVRSGMSSGARPRLSSINIYINNISRTSWLGVRSSAGTYLKCAHLRQNLLDFIHIIKRTTIYIHTSTTMIYTIVEYP
jgi:hypothetical protein